MTVQTMKQAEIAAGHPSKPDCVIVRDSGGATSNSE